MTRGSSVDADAVAQFQFTGQDVPWLLSRLAERRPDHPVLIWEPRSSMTRQWTYAEFWTDVRRVAAGLQSRGIVKGDKVVIHSDNSPEMVLAWYACATVGAVAVTTNTRSVAAEMNYFIDHTKAVAAITQPQYAAVVAASGPDLKWIAVTTDNSGDAATAEQAGHGFDSFDSLFLDVDAFVPREPEPMLPVGVMFTSGTTSRPKAVVHTHANTLWGTRVGPENIGADPDSVYLIFLPFFHVNAQSWSMWSMLGIGGTVVLQPKFSSSRFWDVVVARGVTHISLIPFVYLAVQGQPIPENNLKAAVFGAIAPPLEQLIGCRVLAAYGMTETVTHATRSGLHGDVPPGSLGRATPGYETLIVDPETEEILTDGRVGELWLRGTRGIQLFLEYHDNPEANAKSFTEDGWFKTGDLVRMGEGGAIFYTERDKDMLKVGGENVSSKEVEDLCRTVAGVREVAVVGRSHPMLDVVPVAFVIKAADAPDDVDLESTVIDLCAKNLSDFKVPRAVYFVDDYPRATLDKIAKNQLRDMADDMAAPY
jgi:crotonobetaine/carnitine-CoA ligase